MEHTGHLARHAETTYAALLRTIAQAQTAAAVRVDKVRHKTFFAQLNLTQGIALHTFQARTRVHDWITLLLVFQYLIN